MNDAAGILAHPDGHPTLATCPHCLNGLATTEDQYAALEASPDTEPCPCIDTACGHRLCAEMDDHPPCASCDRCAACCPCTCETCGTALHACEDCFPCVAANQGA